ncbi:MAG: hypothetical protein QGG73_06590, partial [Candidatus Hydrogenedentes bacterium]|nr:hypothetical protein [Candidatus Hydrogenedentota bacterium]
CCPCRDAQVPWQAARLPLTFLKFSPGVRVIGVPKGPRYLMSRSQLGLVVILIVAAKSLEVARKLFT